MYLKEMVRILFANKLLVYQIFVLTKISVIFIQPHKCQFQRSQFHESQYQKYQLPLFQSYQSQKLMRRKLRNQRVMSAVDVQNSEKCLFVMVAGDVVNVVAVLVAVT